MQESEGDKSRFKMHPFLTVSSNGPDLTSSCVTKSSSTELFASLNLIHAVKVSDVSFVSLEFTHWPFFFLGFSVLAKRNHVISGFCYFGCEGSAPYCHPSYKRLNFVNVKFIFIFVELFPTLIKCDV
ncbi:hypothetical protein C5167_041056 [Papaver somniferum]|uniref:Uncharacterized protein n=1 Tax=Papaver somniferum TaxID=3469 RepID=A0A4Y7IGW8_PAPSO|nr:hypothetical protein C5167_041056 [Papaver somniferum]